MEKPGLSATDIGERFGMNGRVTNRALEAIGVLEGGPGDWRPTAKGADISTTVYHDNGYGGYAHRDWEPLYFDPKIADEITPEIVERARAADIGYRLQKKLERAADKEEAELAFQDFQAKQAAANAPAEIDWGRVAIMAAGAIAIFGGVYVVTKYGPAIKQKWNTVSAARAETKNRRKMRAAETLGEELGSATDDRSDRSDD
ncbi:hypothetical protein AB0N59_02150 [Microbacterium sp. NPDC089321]|uniref:hypothetical protein n=1 Tax=Microbacterium sp. NPDC089321 TaxID=3155183 RepID=UPI003441CBAC